MSHHYSGPDFSFPQGDARLDFTDLYAFPKPGDAGKSILIMNVHPSASENPPGPTTTEPFAPDALYELKIDTDGDGVADIAYPKGTPGEKLDFQEPYLRHVLGFIGLTDVTFIHAENQAREEAGSSLASAAEHIGRLAADQSQSGSLSLEITR